METASISLTFRSLIKNVYQNEVKCCVEITPEVSCIENLDKMTWKQHNDCVEYLIPIMYKIILKKRNHIINSDVNTAELDKTYHSCIDLLPPSSLTNVNMASGDVLRNISDTLINNVTANLELGNNFNDVKSQYTLEKKSEHTRIAPRAEQPEICAKRKSCTKVKTNRNRNAVSTPCSPHSHVATYVNLSVQKRDNGFKPRNVVPDLDYNKLNQKKLSVSPICSLHKNYLYDSASDTVDPYNFLNKVSDNDKKCVQVAEYSVSKLKHKDFRMDNIQVLNNIDTIFNFIQTNQSRELPEIRVAKFVQKMERTILPLKNMLNDIETKCAQLGLKDNNICILDRYLCNKISQKETKSIETDNQYQSSNRVVYSIVFDE